MRLIALLNNERGTGLAVNALAQMSLSLGHRLKGYPDVDVYWGTTAQVRAFRGLAAEIAARDLESSVYRDFPHTMEGGDTTALLGTVVSIPETDVTYFASCIVAPEIDPRLLELISTCSQLEGYAPFVSAEKASLLPEIRMPEPTTDDMKTNTLINKLPLAQTLNAVVLANLDVGGKAPLELLHLLTDGRLTFISFNTHPILRPESSAKHAAMGAAASKAEGLYSSTHVSPDGQPLVTVAFGQRAAVEAVILRKQTRAYDAALEFVPARVVHDSAAPACSGSGEAAAAPTAVSGAHVTLASGFSSRHTMFGGAASTSASADAAELIKGMVL